MGLILRYVKGCKGARKEGAGVRDSSATMHIIGSVRPTSIDVMMVSSHEHLLEALLLLVIYVELLLLLSKKDLVLHDHHAAEMMI